MPGVLKLLRYLVDNDLTDIHLDITTNGTRLQGKTFRLLEQFRNVDIQFSMCGTDYTNDYIRTGAEWHQLTDAFHTYTQMPNTRVHIMATVQLYNIFTNPPYPRTQNRGATLMGIVFLASCRKRKSRLGGLPDA